MAADKEKRRIRDAQWREAHREELLEKSRAYYKENREKRLASAAKSREKNKHRIREYNTRYHKEKRREVRTEILSLLGKQCVLCGYDADVRALQIDHVDGGGGIERKRFSNLEQYYRHILQTLRSDERRRYQLLCANCNAIKRMESKECER